jgi:hypothetical protein
MSNDPAPWHGRVDAALLPTTGGLTQLPPGRPADILDAVPLVGTSGARLDPPAVTLGSAPTAAIEDVDPSSRALILQATPRTNGSGA